MIETFADRDSLADAAADFIAGRLAAGGLFVATGGSTPGPVYDRLARRDLPWARIVVTLTDERRVDPDAEESNERLVRERLFVGPAAVARFLPLRDPQAAEALLGPHLPAAVTLMGMGPDGHVASLFPGGAELAEGLSGQGLVMPVAMSGQPPFVARITLTKRALLQTGLIVLAVTGDDKREVLERIAADPAYAPPAAAFLRLSEVPVRTLWAA
jgi:6-phosphogluconolactonase